MRVMGLDYGTKTVGVAISDPLGLTAVSYTHLDVYKRQVHSCVNHFAD